jgi:hypothetical protein
MTFPSAPTDAIWLASYTQLRKHRALLGGVEFGYAVLDEGQFIKNPDAKVTQTCFAVRARAPPRAHRHAAGKPAARPVEHLSLPAPRAARFALLVRGRLAADRDGTLERPAPQLALHPAAHQERGGHRNCRPRSRWS